MNVTMCPRQRPLKILHIITGLGPGGAETVLYRLATSGADVRHEVVSLTGRDWYSSRLEDKGITVHHLDLTSPKRIIPDLLRLNRLIRQSDGDLVQAWMYRANLIAGIVGRAAHMPVIWNIRASSLEPLRWESRWTAYIGGALTRWLPQFVINCSAQSARLHSRWGYDAVDGTIIPNGYDPAVFHPNEKSRAATRKSLGVGEREFLIGSVARWHKMKGFPVLLQAVGLLRKRGLKLRLLLVGRGIDSNNPELAALIRDNGCDDAVLMLGERSDIPEIDRALDLHVLASIGSEGFPNVVAETMLSATPNVVTDVGDAALIVGEAGWVVTPGNADQLAESIGKAHEEWSLSPEKWRSRRDSAHKRIADEFSLERMARAYEEVWRKVLTCGRVKRP